MVKEKIDFVVYDAKTGDDITRPVLTQIIVEEESKGGQTLLPIPFLRQLISFYGDSLQGVVPQYLEMSMTPVRAQPGADAPLPAECVRLQPVPAVRIDGQAEHGDVRERHADVQSVRRRPGRQDAAGQANGAAEPAKPRAFGRSAPDRDAAIDDLKRKLDELQSQLAELSKKTPEHHGRSGASALCRRGA